MKNLSAIPRLSLPETFTILITLVVCLAGFTEAEVHTNYRKLDAKQREENYHLKEASFKRNVPYAHQTSKMTENESEDGKVPIFNNIPLNKLIERHSDEFGESDESDEKESDGYGYDDDEYYHFNFKRNDENLDNSKEKEGVHDSNEKEGVSGQKFLTQAPKEKAKETETIEMLNYKESHPNIDADSAQNTMDGSKPYSDDVNRKKVPSSSNILSSLKMSDLRGNSAIDEKMKDRKDESTLSSGSSEPKTADAKKLSKAAEEKDGIKIKDTKLAEESEQKEKENNLKEGKEAVVGKNLKESPKSTEEKDKGVKLSDSAKLEENLEKISSKTKENDSPKLTKDVDDMRFVDKVTSDVLNPTSLNEINTRASFVSSDYKDNAMKNLGVDEEDKTSDEMNGLETNVGLSDYQDDLRRTREKLRKLYAQRDADESQTYGSFNVRDNTAQIFRDSAKSKDYSPLTFELQNLSSNDLFKRGEWKDAGLEAMKFLTQLPERQRQAMQEQQQQQFLQLQQQIAQDSQAAQQRQSQMATDPRYKNTYGLTFPSNELENTDYHKNYIKSLKRYKGLSADQKSTMSEPSTSAGSVHSPTTSYEDARNAKKKLQETVKRRSMDMHLAEKESAPSKHSKLRRNTHRTDSLLSQRSAQVSTPQAISKSKSDSSFSEGKKQEEQQDSSRATRKSPIKLEYEIKVINQNQQDTKNSELSHIAPRRFEKDLKTKLATEEKYLKKYPYSQVSREDLTKFDETEGERKIKRKAPTWKRRDKKSIIQTRAVPSGYYGNRVKFGQKNYARNNERANTEQASVETAHASSSYLTSDLPETPADKNKLQRSWEVRQQDYKHDPMKRYDESGYMNNKGNSLLLVRKGERTATSFEDGSFQPASENNLSPDNLAKILSRDNDYIVLKKTDSNRFQKISESSPPTAGHLDVGGLNYPSKFNQEEQEGLKNNVKQTLKNKGLYVRSFHPEKEEKKLSSTSHSSKSNLKKTFDKFRDLAGFFKDNEQESTDNQYSAQELKEGRDIVFSEDKLPDPIVISNDGTGKSMAFNQKQQNSIYSISTNFKTLDQQDKKNEMPTSNESDKNMFTAEAKSDNSESSWEPALRNIFPEAKSINSVSKNGNEIIILDLNRNQLKTDHNKMASKPQQMGALGLTSQVPMNMGNAMGNPLGNNMPMGNNIPNSNAIQVKLSLSPSKLQSLSKTPQKIPFANKARNNRAYAVVKTGDSGSQVSIRDLSDLPSLLRALTDKKPNSKLLTKRSPPRSTNAQVSDNYRQFLTDLNELSELNKNSYKKGKLNVKRNSDEIVLPSSSFPELSTYGDANIKYLGNLLHNIMTGENPEFKGISGVPVESSDGGISKYLEESLKANKAYLNSGMPEPERNSKYQGNLGAGKAEKNFFRDQRDTAEDRNYQDVILAELAAASDKINRLRREGAGARKLRKTIEESLALSGKRETGTPDASAKLKSEDKCSKMDSAPVGLSTKEKTAFDSQLKSDHETKESSDKSFLKSDYENHLSEFFENLNAHKNQKDQLNVPNESTWKRKKRKENHRRKRSASLDVKNKVSTTAVQNTILKNLAEDNYQSIYSPGIKRRLFSTNNEADDADNYSDAYESDKNVIAEEAQPKCVKNKLNKCIDPMIVELFGAVDKEEKNRARRSLNSGFHSNFKREIDLDESMPNDFQNFLVTSLGGFGSQNREVIKKDVALWERKESTQDANQIAESSPPGGKDDPNSTLEKREVPSSENRKGQTYFPGANSDSNMSDAMNPQKKLRSDNKSKLKSKAEFAEDKLPTQIRIQITNASSKEKKSSKPIMDESETTSTEMENLPKEKEFFDKNKINPLRLSTIPKLHNPTKNKFSFSDYEEPENTDSSGSQTYRPHRRRRKKKKYVPENPIKPIKDFIKFDQKTMETFLKKIISDQNMVADQTTQKSPVSNHLPQVETVYNPTQGTNKAQLEVSRFGKINSANNKNTGTNKNNLQSTETIGYDEGILRNYLKDKTDKIKSDKVKEFEDIDWKPRFGKMRLRQDIGWEPTGNNFNMPTLKTPMTDSSTFSINTDSPSYLNPFGQHLYTQKNAVPSSSYFFHPSNTNSENSNSLYDALKLKQEIKNQNGLASDRSTSKMFKKPFYYNNIGLFKTDEKDRNQNALYPGLNAGEGSWNYEYTLTKKPTPRGFKSRDFFSSGMKSPNRLDSKSKLAHSGSRKFMKSMEDEKSFFLDTPQFSPMLENSKDTDYLDNLGADDDYLDDDSGKEMQTEEQLLSLPLKYHRLYSSDIDDNMNEDEEEIDEDYDENNEDEDPEDYSLLANTKAMDPELTKNGHRKVKFQSSFNDDKPLSQINYIYPKDNLLELRGHSFEQTEFTNSKNDVKFNQGRQQIPLVDLKTDVGSLAGSTSLLKKANDNANIFGKNLMKNTFGYTSENGLPNSLSENKMKELNALYHHNKLFKRKMDSQGKLKRSRDFPQIGNRLFYAAKTEIEDNDSGPSLFHSLQQKKTRNSRQAFCPLNPFKAEFADPGNNFDNESEENDNDNLMNFGKNLQDDEETDKDSNKEEDLEDVAENLEDDGETISEDNVLENVIGKYIMRKRVASSADINNSESSQTEGQHNLKKRSLGKQKYEKTRNVKLVKRLSSGHLTENNFRKFHKKNLTRKREINEFDFVTRGNSADEETNLRRTRKREHATQRKRSALDLFKKITNKDRDSKKVENVDGRTAGFEPLSSLNDKKYESSIRDAKFEFLNQVKKLENECPQTPMKSSVVELKSHVPLEGQLTPDQRKKEKVKLTIKDNAGTTGQGPWRIELNDKYNVKYREIPKSSDKVREVEPVTRSQESENLKAFLVFSNNLRAFKRSTVDNLSATSGSSQKEVGNSYRRKSDEGRGISKMHVSKRSLDSSLVTIDDEDAARTSRDHFVNIEEKNRALHDTESLSEGDSNPQPPPVLQRNTKFIRSFVNDDEQCPNDRFPSEGNLNNRKSVFPPSNDANIMRDSRQVNEETSKYLGQQIVDAILSHVSANPKFKQLIAPGLNLRTTAYKEDFDVTEKPLQQVDISDQLQYFLQKFMIDLEKLAEKHVRKRMCTQIDQQSKEFLRSLLNVSGSRSADNNCPISEEYTEIENIEDEATVRMSEAPKPEPTPAVQESNTTGPLENLKKKHCLLLKLIEDYEKLSKLEQDSLHVNYQYLLDELQQTNRELGSMAHTAASSVCQPCTKKLEKLSSVTSKPPRGFEDTLTEKENATPLQCQNFTYAAPQKWQHENHSPESGQQNSGNDDCSKSSTSKPKCPLPTYSFDEDVSKNSQAQKVTPPPVFEPLENVNITENSTKNNATCENRAQGEEPQNEDEIIKIQSPTPQSFDLLPFQNSTKGIISNPTNEPSGNSGSFPFPQSLSDADSLENSHSQFSENSNRLNELNKLSLGDAAGLQLSLKYRGPWVSNLDVAKTIRNVPVPAANSISLPKPYLGGSLTVPKTISTAVDVPPETNARNSRSLIEPNDEYSSLGNPLLKKNAFSLALFPYINFEMFIPKSRPFESVSKNVGALRSHRIPCNYFLSKVSASGRKRVFLRSNDFSQSSNDFPQTSNDFSQAPSITQNSPSRVFRMPTDQKKSQNILIQFPYLLPQSSNYAAHAPKVLTLTSNIVPQTPNVISQQQIIPIQSSEVQSQSPDFLHQTVNGLSQHPKISSETFDLSSEYPKVLSQSQDTSSKILTSSSNFPSHYPKVASQFPDFSFHFPKNIPADFPSHYPKTPSQPSDFPSRYPKVLTESLDVPAHYGKIPSQTSLSLDTQSQSSDVLSKYPNLLPQVPDILVQSQSHESPSKFPTFSRGTAEVSPQSTRVLQQSSDNLSRTPNIVHESVDFLSHTPNTVQQSSDLFPYASNAVQKTSDEVSSKIVHQPLNFASNSPNIIHETPDSPSQSPNIIPETSDLQSSSPGVVHQTPEVLSQSPVVVMESLDVQSHSSDIQSQSPDTELQTPSIQFQPSETQTQTPHIQFQPSETQTQTPHIQFQPSETQTQTPYIQFQPFDIHSSAPNVPNAASILNVVPQTLDTQPQAPNTMSQSADTPSQSSSQPQSIEIQNPTMSHSTNTVPQTPNEISNELPQLPKERKPFSEHDYFKKNHNKKHRPFAHFSSTHEKKHKKQKKSKKSLEVMKNTNDEEEDGKNSELEYIAWSTMPAVRRQLNKLETGLELDEFFLKSKKLRKISKGGENKPI